MIYKTNSDKKNSNNKSENPTNDKKGSDGSESQTNDKKGSDGSESRVNDKIVAKMCVSDDKKLAYIYDDEKSISK